MQKKQHKKLNEMKLMCFMMAVATVVITACNGSAGGRSAKATDTIGVVTGEGGELPLPVMPSGITDPTERADYLMAHFWDAMNFADVRLCRDTAFMEQNFVNFIQLHHYGTTDGSHAAMRRLLDAATASESALAMIRYVAERYLNDPESPMRDERTWTVFLEELLATDKLSEDDLLRPAAQLATARKNSPGTVAADFSYVTRDGRRQTLHGAPPASRTLLLFYDPSCEHCEEEITALRDNDMLGMLVSRGALRVLAVCAEEDRALWERTKSTLPADWTVAYDLSGILQKELYALPAMPTIYVLDSDNTVVLKDPRPDVLYGWIADEAAGL